MLYGVQAELMYTLQHSNLGHILTRTYFLTTVHNFTAFCLFFVWFDSYCGFHVSLSMPTTFVSIVYLGLLNRLSDNILPIKDSYNTSTSHIYSEINALNSDTYKWYKNRQSYWRWERSINIPPSSYIKINNLNAMLQKKKIILQYLV